MGATGDSGDACVPAVDTQRFDPLRPGHVRPAAGITRGFASLSHPSLATSEQARPVLIVGNLYFTENPGIETFRAELGPKLMALPLFRSVLRVDAGAPHFLELAVEDIDLDYHFEDVDDREMSERDLDQYLSDMYARDMDPERPLWMFKLLHLDDGRVALVAIFDHVLADGTTAVAILKDIVMDQDLGGDSRAEPATIIKRPKPVLGLWGKLVAFFTGMFRGFFGIVLPSDPPSRLKLADYRNPSNGKAVAFSEALELSRVKEVKKRFPGASLNDICLALMTMTIRAYLEEIDDPILRSKKTMRGNFPYDLRESGVDVLRDAFGNEFATPGFRFPLHYESAKGLITAIKAQVERIKISPEPIIDASLTRLVCRMRPKVMFKLMLDKNAKVTSMLSNVRGPDDAVTVCGHEVDDLRFYAFAPIGLYFGVLTYNGKLTASVALDPTCEDDATRLAKHWRPAFDELYQDVVGAEGSDGDEASSATPAPAQSESLYAEVATIPPPAPPA